MSGKSGDKDENADIRREFVDKVVNKDIKDKK